MREGAQCYAEPFLFYVSTHKIKSIRQVCRMVKTFVKKPVQVQTVQWTGDNDEEIKEFVGKECDIIRVRTPGIKPDLIIHTLEGDHHALVGDYIIRGIKGEFYPCKPDIFEKTYEEVTHD